MAFRVCSSTSTPRERSSRLPQDRASTGVEYWLETPHFWLRDLPAAEVIAAKEAHPGIHTLTVHTPVLDLNPCSINPDVAEVSVAWAVRSLEMAQELGATVLTVHPGRRTA